MKHVQYPLLLPFLALVSGVVFYSQFQISYPAFWLLLLCFVMAVLSFKSLWARRILLPFFLAVAFFLMGWWRADFVDDRNQAHHITQQNFSKSAVFYGRVLESLKPTTQYQRLEVQLQGVKDSIQFPVMGKVLLNLPIAWAGISENSEIAWKGRLQNFQKPAFKGAFDYGAYLNKKGVFGQFYLREKKDLKVLKTHQKAALSGATYRKKALEALQTLEMEMEGKAFLAALLLGSKDDLSADQRQDFSAAGTMHLLAVSGLHVGIIYLIGFHLLGMGRGPVGHFWKVPLLLLFIWLYAGITGFSPSVTRAATMFSGFALGSLFMRRTNTLNMLLASALVLLFINPPLLMHPGFQLSYAAVWAIVSFVPIFQKWWPTKNFIALKIRDLLTVSLAAQLGTLPLTLYYFQTFPTYFLVGNLLVLPVIPVVMYLGILALIAGFLGFPGSWLVQVLDFVLMVLNKFVGAVAEWPIAQITFPQWPLLFYVLMAVCAGYFLMYLKKYNFQYLLGVAILLVLMSVVQLWQVHQTMNTAGILVTTKNAQTAVLGFDGFQTRWLAPPVDAFQKRVAEDFIRIKGLQKPEWIEHKAHQKLVQMGKTLVAVGGVPNRSVDYVIWPSPPSKSRCNANGFWLLPQIRHASACWAPKEEISGTRVVEWEKPSK